MKIVLDERNQIPSAPRLGSYTNATGSDSRACGCEIRTARRGVVLCVPCETHAGVMIVEMRPRA